MITARNLAAVLHLRRVPHRPEWRGTCPSCGYKTGFAVKEKDGRTLWWCASCQDKEAITTAVSRVLGRDSSPPAPASARTSPGAASTAQTSRALALYEEAKPLLGTVGEDYFAGRGLPGIASTALRYHPACAHPSGARLPAVIALATHATTGVSQAIHRTYLCPDGSGKATVESQKATLGPMAGAVIMLDRPRTKVPLVIAEGIETAASAGQLIGAPAWSSVSAGNLAKLDLPPGIARVIIAADPDGPGQRAAWQAAERWRAEGRQVHIATPDDPGADFNDLLLRHLARERHHGG